ncbi:hypothetical protein FA95DRAFT_1567267 [Auriscalpium vulgare]|uniref:Uncharacterized protein n=1 Tax=Auriscalpium vulgare TaxID=40419 RepID=A0ACB8R5D4_9AGAM|nr:hypothetical protein FA95DRAFT_1567267 [Auriscalpium vulgare]
MCRPAQRSSDAFGAADTRHSPSRRLLALLTWVIIATATGWVTGRTGACSFPVDTAPTLQRFTCCQSAEHIRAPPVSQIRLHRPRTTPYAKLAVHAPRRWMDFDGA